MALIIREMQVKTTMRYHFIPIRRAILNKSTNVKCWRGCGEKGNPRALLLGVQTGTATVESSMEFPQKLKMEPPYNPVILLLGIYLKKPKTPIHNNIRTAMFIAALFTMAEIQKQPQCPAIDGWRRSCDNIYTMEYYLAIKKNKILPFATA